MGDIIYGHRPDVIFATFPPVETLMLGMDAAKKYNMPLVIDFRDGMAFESLEKENIFSSWRWKNLEKKLVDSSDYIISATDPITEYFEKNYPGCHAKTITNGFDPEEWKDLKNIDLAEKINIVYTGRLSKSRSVGSVGALPLAIKLLEKKYQKRLCLHMVGDFTEREREGIANNLPCEVVRFTDLVARREALRYQKSADLLLLVAPPEARSVATGKIFEYLAASKPILALTEGTVAEDIIKKTGTGICINPSDTEKIGLFLKKFIEQYPKCDFYKPITEEINKFSRLRLAEELAKIFDALH